MDDKQFDALIAKLAKATSRRNAVNGVIGGGLAAVGVTSVASAGPKGKKAGQNKVEVCHKGKKTLLIPEPALAAHIGHGDTPGPCPYGG
jgi:hypothetical protein